MILVIEPSAKYAQIIFPLAGVLAETPFDWLEALLRLEKIVFAKMACMSFLMATTLLSCKIKKPSVRLSSNPNHSVSETGFHLLFCALGTKPASNKSFRNSVLCLVAF